MKFTDYPKDLQRIVELTPKGWPDNVEHMHLDGQGIMFSIGIKPAQGMYDKHQYNQCRAQWLAEVSKENELPVEFCADAVAAMNEPVKPYVRRSDRVDWRGLCEELVAAWHMGDLDDVGEAIDKARKALEQTK